jgi:hypothetical protein
MNEFEILDSPEKISYFCMLEHMLDPQTKEDAYLHQHLFFSNSTKKNFLNELSGHADIKKQAGYSKLRDCDYISIILVFENYGDGEFTGHHIQSTCLVNKNGDIKDANDNIEEHGEMSSVIRSVYHQLPDGKLLEYKLKKYYQDELANIYNDINKIRSHHELNRELPVNNVPTKNGKFKL